MKKFLFGIIVLFACKSYGQINDSAVTVIHYVFNNFTPGEIKMKSGSVIKRTLNYNMVTNEMIFDHQGSYLAIAEPWNVDTVTIASRKFIPGKKNFYEVLTYDKIALLALYEGTIEEKGNNTGYGGSTTTSAANPVKSLHGELGAYRMKLPDDYKVTSKQTFFLLKEGGFHKISNRQQLEKLLPEKKQTIRDWINANNTNFSKKQDLILLVNQVQ